MTNSKSRAPRNSASSSKDKRANGEGSIYWDKSKKRWIGAAYDINGKLHRKTEKGALARYQHFCHKSENADW